MPRLAATNLRPQPEEWGMDQAVEIQNENYLAPYTPPRDTRATRDIGGMAALNRLTPQTLPAVVFSRVGGTDVVVQGREVIDALAEETEPGERWWVNVIRDFPLDSADFLGLTSPRQTPRQLLSRAGITYYNYKPGAIRWYVRFRHHNLTGTYKKVRAPRADLMRDEVLRYGNDRMDHFIREATKVTDAYPDVSLAILVGLFMEANEGVTRTDVIDSFVARLVEGGGLADNDPVQVLRNTLLLLTGTATGERWRDRQARLFTWAWEDAMNGTIVVKGEKGRKSVGPIVYDVDSARFTPVRHVDEAAVRRLRRAA